MYWTLIYWSLFAVSRVTNGANDASPLSIHNTPIEIPSLFNWKWKWSLLKILIGIVILVILGGIGGVGYTLTIGKWQKNAEREVFKDSVAYTEQAASFLAKSYKEYNDAETDADKKTVMEYVIMRYPNLDTDSIDNSTLKQFYIKCLNN